MISRGSFNVLFYRKFKKQFLLLYFIIYIFQIYDIIHGIKNETAVVRNRMNAFYSQPAVKSSINS